MKLKKTVVEQLGKVFLNLGQGMVIAGLVASIIEQKIALGYSILSFIIGMFTVFIGLYFIGEAEEIKE